MSLTFAVAAAAASAAACGGKVQAKTPGPTPSSLAMPEPPSRAVVPATIDLSAPPPATERPATPPPARSTTTGSRPASTPVPTPTPSPSPSPTPVPPASETPVLQSAASLRELQTNAQTTLNRATTALGSIKRETLKPDAKDQYDNAKRWITQATDAMTTKNFVYALSCAEKAAALLALIK